MGRTPIHINYLKEIKPIKIYLRDTTLSKKSLKTKFLALDKFFPFLVQRFRNKIDEIKIDEIKEIYKFLELNYENNEQTDELFLKTVIELEPNQKNEFNKMIGRLNVANKIFEIWITLTSNTKSNLLTKWAKISAKLNGENKKNPYNTYVNYIWRIQGLFSRLGTEFEANPKNLDQIKSDFNLSQDINYDDVAELYEVLPPKYKLILKIMMYSGLNGEDIVNVKPIDFKPYKNEEKYGEKEWRYIWKIRIKTNNKDIYYLLVFDIPFYIEIKDYFSLKRNWEKHKNECIFPIASNTITDVFKHHRDKNGLNPKLLPSEIRKLCFTRLEDVFSLKDRSLFDIWSQHKPKDFILEKHYITNKLDKAIKYLPKIQEKVLIGNVRSYIAEINGYKKGMEKIAELEARDKDIAEILQGIKPFLAREYRGLREDHMDYIDEKTPEKYKKEIQELETNFQDLKKVMDKIDELVKKQKKE